MVGERKLLVRGLGKGSIEKTVALILVILACGFLHPSPNRPAQEPRADKPPSGQAAGRSREAIVARAASLAVPFVRNAGRFDKQVRYSADLFSGRFFLTDQELVYSLVKHSGKKSAQPDRTGWSTMPAKNAPKKGIAFKEYFVNEKGSRIYFEPFGEEKGTTKISYFRGNDPAKWQSGLASYNSVYLGDIYPGIQVKLRASGKNIEKIFCASPGSNVARIRIGVAGVKGLEITSDGRLLFKNSVGELAMRAPVAWQEIAGRRRDVKVGYRLLAKQVYGFAVADDYDKNQSLVIDPELDTLLASTFLGGTGTDIANALALDGEGNVYVAGSTSSIDFPTSVGAFDRTLNPEKIEDHPYPDYFPHDVFVSKLNRDLTLLLASTYLGGDTDTSWLIGWDEDAACSLVLDLAGNVYLTGSTGSLDFPTTPGAYSRKLNQSGSAESYDHEDAFVSKLNGDLTRLLASTFLGGRASDGGNSLALDRAENVYITGYTNSADFPASSGGYDRTYHGDHNDIFITKLNGHLSELLASTFLGGSKGDSGHSLVLDSSGDVYLTGSTSSTNFPIADQAFDKIYNGGIGDFSSNGDIFVSKLDGNLATLLASTYLGGSLNDNGYSLALDSAGNVFLTGKTNSEDFPTTPGSYDRAYNGGDHNYSNTAGDVFVSKLNGDLTRLLASTYLGGGVSESGSSLAVDGIGNVYLTGDTLSSDFPTTPGAYDRTNQVGDHSNSDAFVSKLDENLTALLASTFLGGAYRDRGYALLMDGSGNVCLAGACSAGFPTTPGAFERTAMEVLMPLSRN